MLQHIFDFFSPIQSPKSYLFTPIILQSQYFFSYKNPLIVLICNIYKKIIKKLCFFFLIELNLYLYLKANWTNSIHSLFYSSIQFKFMKTVLHRFHRTWLLQIILPAMLLLGWQNHLLAVTCPGATVIPASPTLPYTSTLTCGATNDLTGSNTTACGSTSYLGGLEAVYAWTPSLSYSNVTIAYTGATWTGIFLYAGCPTSGGTCIGNITSSAASKTLTFPGTNGTTGSISLTSGTTYYIVIDTWPSPASPCPGSITLNGTPLISCSGTPSAGTISGAPANACSGTNFTMSLTGATTGSGLTYQWESANDLAFTSGVTALGTASTQTTNQTTTKYYRCTITCAAGGGSPTFATTPVVTVGMNPFLNCYCAAVPTSMDADGITNITGLGSLTNPNISTTFAQDFTSTVPAPDLSIGTTYSTTVSLQTGYTYRVWVFIDYNQNGSYSDPGEAHDLGLSSNINPTFVTANITIPTTALGGVTGMRIVGTDDDFNTTPCYNGTWANVENYLVNILCPAPTAGAASSITSTSATLGWTVSGGNNFDIEFGAGGFTPTGTATHTSTTNSLAMTGLTPSTAYSYYVRTNCGGGSYSAWSGPYNFTTGAATDVAIQNIVIVDRCIVGSPSNVTVVVNNVGLSTIAIGATSVTLTDGTNTYGPLTNTTALAPATTETLTFSANFASGASYALTATGTTTGDGNATNDVATLTNIVGVASAGTTTTTAPGAICPSVSFNLGLTGVSAAPSVAYQWEVSTNGGTSYSPISGANTNAITGRTQSVTSMYRCALTCGGTFYSTPVTVTTSSFASCYCTANLHSASSNCITNVTFGTINNNSTTCALPSYTVYPVGTATTNLSIGTTTPITVTAGSGAWIGAWIDFNQNGAFESTEFQQIALTSTNTGAPITVGFAIPTTALPGQTGMRIRTRTVDMTGTDACTSFGSGETENYIVNILCPAPSAGSASAITATGATLNWTIAGGSNFDIELGLDAFTPTGTATHTSATNSVAVTSLTASTDYDFYVRTNCGGGSYSAWAGPYSFTTGSATDVEISALTIVDKCIIGAPATVTFVATNVGIDPVNPGDIEGWVSYNGVDYGPVFNANTLNTGDTETLTFDTGSLGAGNEIVFAAAGSVTLCTACGTAMTFTAGDANAANDNVTLTTTVGVVSAGTTTATVSSVCGAAAFNLALTGVNAASSVTYQWEVSTSGAAGPYTAISGANTNAITGQTQTATSHYRCALTCGGTSYSTPVQVTTNPFYNCYCAVSVNTQDELISNVSVADINNSSTGFGTAGYQDFTTITGNMIKGSTYPVSVAFAPFYSGDVAAIWIDFDQSGTFENPGERVFMNAPTASPAAGTLTVPLTALTGITRMRVRLDYNNTNPAPCGNTSYGNVEDYLVNITPCTPPTTIASTTGTHYATGMCTDGTWTYYYSATDLLLALGQGGAGWSPTGTLVQTATPAAGQYAVRVDLDPSSTVNLITTTTGYTDQNNTTVMNRTWDVVLNNSGQQPSGAVDVRSYFSQAEFDAVNTAVGNSIPSPSDMFMYKLQGVSPAPYANSFAALADGHAQVMDANFILYHSNPPATQNWIYTANAPSAGNHTAQISVASFSGGGGGGSAGGLGPFPVELMSFGGYNQENVNVLNWVTANELNNQGFTVLRSTDNINFSEMTKVASLAPNGTSATSLTYGAVDQTPAYKTYYKLQQTDINGATRIIGNTVEITMNSGLNTSVSVYPNPATNVLNVSIITPIASEYNVNVYDIAGKLVTSSAVSAETAGVAMTKLDVSTLAKGFYTVVVETKGSAVSSSRFIKE